MATSKKNTAISEPPGYCEGGGTRPTTHPHLDSLSGQSPACLAELVIEELGLSARADNRWGTVALLKAALE